MAILGAGDYLCEMCKYFNTDGIDGNHPYCMKQDIDNSKAVRIGDMCYYGWKLGVPSGYTSSIESNRKRALELLDKIDFGSDIWQRHDTAHIETCHGDHPPYPLFEGDAWTMWYICSKCKGAIDIGDRFCKHCGAKVINNG